MTAPRRRREAVPPLAVDASEAAHMLGISRASFDRHVAGELRFVRIGKAKRYPVAGLQQWLERSEQVIS